MVTLCNFNHQGVWVDSTEEEGIILTDGDSYLHAGTCAGIYTVFIDPAGETAEIDYSHEYHGILFPRYGRNRPEKNHFGKQYPSGIKPAFKDERPQIIGTFVIRCQYTGFLAVLGFPSEKRSAGACRYAGCYPELGTGIATGFARELFSTGFSSLCEFI